MIAKSDAVKIAEVIAAELEFQEGKEGWRPVWNVAQEMALLIEEETQARTTTAQFLSWCQTGPGKIADIERQLGGAA